MRAWTLRSCCWRAGVRKYSGGTVASSQSGSRSSVGATSRTAGVSSMHLAGGADRVAGVPGRGDRPGAPVAGHDAGVELGGAGGGQRGAAAGVEQRVVLELLDGGADRVEGAAAGGQHGGARLRRPG